MRLVVLKREENELHLKVEGESHTLVSPLVDVLLDDPRVDIAYYDMEFPTISEPVVVVRTNGEDPITAVRDATKQIAEECDTFIEAFSSALSKVDK